MLKGFIICRQSSASEADESLSIAAQEEACRALCKEEDIQIVEVFKEQNVSGRLYPTGYEEVAKSDFIFQQFVKDTRKEFQFREGLGEILRRINEVSVVVCYDQTRLMRPLNGSFLQNIIVQKFIANGVKVLSKKEGLIDFSSFNDSLISSLTSHINSEQLLIQRQKAIEARKKKQDAGDFAVGLYKLYGYSYINKKIGVEIVNEEAEYVKYVVDEYLKGTSPSRICKEANVKFANVLKDRHCFNPTHFINSCINPIYAGYCYNTDGVLIPFSMTKGKEIYSLETFLSLKNKKESKKVAGTRSKKNVYPLSNKTFCGVCGRKMRAFLGSKWKGVAYFKYICSSQFEESGSAHCKTGLQIHHDTEEGFCLHSAIRPLLIAEAFRRAAMTLKNNDNVVALENVDFKLKSTIDKEKKLTSMFTDDLLSEDTYREKLVELKEERKKLSALKAELLEPNSNNDYASQLKTILDFDNISMDEYMNLSRDFIKRIDVNVENIKVTTTMGIAYIPRQQMHRSNRCYHAITGLEHDFIKNGMDLSKSRAQVVYYKGKKREVTIDEMERNAKLVSTLGQLDIYYLE